MTLPNFIIGGAPKCGTTALWAYMDEHPDVFLASLKEPRFFSRMKGQLEKGIQGSGPNRSGRYAKGLSWYSSLFESAGSAHAVGEASTYYFSATDAAELIQCALPDVRLIFLLRDPVERAYSHYWEEYKLGWDLPTFSELLKSEHPRLTYYCHVSSYQLHLQKFLSVFPSRNVLVLLTRELNDRPAETLARVCDFLGVDSHWQPTTLGKRFNEQTRPRSRRLDRWIAMAHGSDMAYRLPERARNALGQVRRRILAWNAEPNRYPPLGSEERARLLPRFTHDVAWVEELLDVDLADWRTA